MRHALLPPDFYAKYVCLAFLFVAFPMQRDALTWYVFDRILGVF